MGDQHHAVNRGQGRRGWSPSPEAREAFTGLMHVPASRRRHVTWTQDMPPGFSDQAARFIRRPARRQNPWLLPLFVSALAGIVLSIGLDAATGTLWGMSAYLPWAACFTGYCLWMADH